MLRRRPRRRPFQTAAGWRKRRKNDNWLISSQSRPRGKRTLPDRSNPIHESMRSKKLGALARPSSWLIRVLHGSSFTLRARRAASAVANCRGAGTHQRFSPLWPMLFGRFSSQRTRCAAGPARRKWQKRITAMGAKPFWVNQARLTENDRGRYGKACANGCSRCCLKQARGLDTRRDRLDVDRLPAA